MGKVMRIVFKDGSVVSNVFEMHYSVSQGMGVIKYAIDPVDYRERIFEDDEILRVEFVERS